MGIAAGLGGMSTIGQAAVGLQAAGAAGSFITNIAGARSARAGLESQARIAAINAQIAESNAKVSEIGARQALERGAREEQGSRLKTAALKSTQRAAMAANGVDLASDSAVATTASTDYLGEIDAQQIAENAIANAWGYRMQAQNQRAAGGQQRMQGNAARAGAAGISPFSTGVSSLLTGAGQVASSWYSVSRGVTGRAGG